MSMASAQYHYDHASPDEGPYFAHHEAMHYWLEGIEHAITAMRQGRSTYEKYVPAEDRIDVAGELRRYVEMLEDDIAE